jgi:hypothetical protein
MKLISLILILLFSFSTYSQVHVKGYYRSNGTYVKPHIRSSPDSSRSNNYGSAKSAGSNYSGDYTSPSLRDHDNDGISNQYDNDDDNDGISDDNDSSQYGF